MRRTLSICGLVACVAFSGSRGCEKASARFAVEPSTDVSLERPSPDGARPTPGVRNLTRAAAMGIGQCYAGSALRDQDAAGGFAPSDNAPKPITVTVARTDCYLLAEPEVVARHADGTGLRLVLVNASNGVLKFEASDRRLNIVQEAFDASGVWRPIEYLPSSSCGNSYHRVYLEPGTFWAFAVPRYDGPMRTRLRFVLRTGAQTLVSNEFEGAIDPAQFHALERHRPDGWMDPLPAAPAMQPEP